jgi:serine/threonine protein kinase
MEGFHERLSRLGGQPTEDTICLENTRLGEKYLIFDLLAAGRCSTLYYGIEESSRAERVFKFYNLRELENCRSFKEKELCKRLSNYEYSLARKCDSIHLLHYYDIYEDRNSKVIVSEYCNLGSLAAEIAARKGQGTDQLKAIAILKQVVSALKVAPSPPRTSTRTAAYSTKT